MQQLVTIQISLPDALYEFALRRVSEGGYENISAYLSALLQVEAQRRLEAKLLEGLSSPLAPLTQADFDKIGNTITS